MYKRIVTQIFCRLTYFLLTIGCLFVNNIILSMRLPGWFRGITCHVSNQQSVPSTANVLTSAAARINQRPGAAWRQVRTRQMRPVMPTASKPVFRPAPMAKEMASTSDCSQLFSVCSGPTYHQLSITRASQKNWKNSAMPSKDQPSTAPTNGCPHPI